MSPDVVESNVLQVRVQAKDHPARGIFKVMTERQVSDEFTAEKGWTSGGISPTLVGSNTMSNNAFQILTHHWLYEGGRVEAWYVTVRPAF